MTKIEFLDSINTHQNYFYTNDLLSSYFVDGQCIGKRRKSYDPEPTRGSILIVTTLSNRESYKLKPYGWYDEMYFTISDIREDNSVFMYTQNGDGIVNEYILFLEDLKLWKSDLPDLKS